MVRINNQGYLERKVTGSKGGYKEKVTDYRNWWLAWDRVDLNTVRIPEQYRGKRVRFKIEIVD